MAEAEPKFIDRLQQIFTKHHTLGDEQDYTGTAAFPEQFIPHVISPRDRQRRGENSPVGNGQRGAPDEMACPVGGHQLWGPRSAHSCAQHPAARSINTVADLQQSSPQVRMSRFRTYRRRLTARYVSALDLN